MTAKIIGRKYSDIPTYSSWDYDREFPRFDKIKEQVWEIEVDTLREAEAWLAKHHPEYYMGSTIVCGKSFACKAVPNSEYGAGNYETNSERVAWVLREVAR